MAARAARENQRGGGKRRALKRDLDQGSVGNSDNHYCMGDAEQSYDELVQLARLCAEQARTYSAKDVARAAWRMAVEYREKAAKLGEPPDIGEKPPHCEET
jgi:hypothetical protein